MNLSSEDRKVVVGNTDEVVNQKEYSSNSLDSGDVVVETDKQCVQMYYENETIDDDPFPPFLYPFEDEPGLNFEHVLDWNVNKSMPELLLYDNQNVGDIYRDKHKDIKYVNADPLKDDNTKPTGHVAQVILTSGSKTVNSAYNDLTELNLEDIIDKYGSISFDNLDEDTDTFENKTASRIRQFDLKCTYLNDQCLPNTKNDGLKQYIYPTGENESLIADKSLQSNLRIGSSNNYDSVLKENNSILHLSLGDTLHEKRFPFQERIKSLVIANSRTKTIDNMKQLINTNTLVHDEKALIYNAYHSKIPFSSPNTILPDTIVSCSGQVNSNPASSIFSLCADDIFTSIIGDSQNVYGPEVEDWENYMLNKLKIFESMEEDARRKMCLPSLNSNEDTLNLSQMGLGNNTIDRRRHVVNAHTDNQNLLNLNVYSSMVNHRNPTHHLQTLSFDNRFNELYRDMHSRQTNINVHVPMEQHVMPSKDLSSFFTKQRLEHMDTDTDTDKSIHANDYLEQHLHNNSGPNKQKSMYDCVLSTILPCFGNTETNVQHTRKNKKIRTTAHGNVLAFTSIYKNSKLAEVDNKHKGETEIEEMPLYKRLQYCVNVCDSPDIALATTKRSQSPSESTAQGHFPDKKQTCTGNVLNTHTGNVVELSSKEITDTGIETKTGLINRKVKKEIHKHNLTGDEDNDIRNKITRVKDSCFLTNKDCSENVNFGKNKSKANTNQFHENMADTKGINIREAYSNQFGENRASTENNHLKETNKGKDQTITFVEKTHEQFHKTAELKENATNRPKDKTRLQIHEVEQLTETVEYGQHTTDSTKVGYSIQSEILKYTNTGTYSNRSVDQKIRFGNLRFKIKRSDKFGFVIDNNNVWQSSDNENDSNSNSVDGEKLNSNQTEGEQMQSVSSTGDIKQLKKIEFEVDKFNQNGKASESLRKSIGTCEDLDSQFTESVKDLNIYTNTENNRKAVRVKERRTYLDQELDDDDIEGKRSYKIEDKILQTERYNKQYVQEKVGEDFNLKFLQENGLQFPIVFKEKSGLGLRVPSDNFKVCDVKACVGSRRTLDVMDVNTQKGLEMTMKEWVKYYENLERDRLLNVISLEFSHTKLENYVESPNLVREIDWVDTAWPQHLKDCQTESTNAIDKMKYPKVQKYCLMSVAGCYTDFHIDFGGTSVWYHLLHGEKIFWLTPPTSKNLAAYENWVLSGKQGDAFLADTIDDCQMIHLKAGNTFIIPSGWIHAVYTPKDSLVFGGNFLHSFNMVNQLRVSAIEDKTHVPMKFRYPFYAEINWYVLERYVHSLTGVTYLEKPQLNEDMEVINTKIDKDTLNPDLLEDKLNKRLSVSLTRIDLSPRSKSTSDDDSTASGPTRSPGQSSAQPRLHRKSSSESSNSADMKISDKSEKNPKVPYKSPVKKKTKYVHLTKFELEGLVEIVAWIENLAPTKKGIPKDMIDADTVLSEVKRLIQEHMQDNPEMAITGEPVLEWTKATKKLIKLKQKVKTAKLLGNMSAPKVKGLGKNASGSRHRRVRCKKCEPCTRDDCMECNFCKDMKKYGGPGRAKQSCISRQCLAPMLPNNVSCLICKLDKQLKDIPLPASDDGDNDYLFASLMECGICWEIVHPYCMSKKYENLNNDGVINEDLPNSWKCSKCCLDGKEGQLKTRVFKGGWRPNPTGTPPPQAEVFAGTDEYPIPADNNIPEGKRVTLNQTGEPKPKFQPKLLSPQSPQTSIADIKAEPIKTEQDTKAVKQEMVDEPVETEQDIKPVKTEKDIKPVKMETESQPQPKYIKTKTKDGIKEEYPSNGMNGSSQKSDRQKRRISPEPETSGKKRRVQSLSPAKSSPSRAGAKSAKLSPARSYGKLGHSNKEAKNRSPELTTKRTKRETDMGYGSHNSSLYDFDQSEMMDISSPLPDKGKGRGMKGRKLIPLKDTLPGSSFHIHKNKPQVLPEIRDMRGVTPKKTVDKTNNDQLKKTLLEHIEMRNLKIVVPKFVVRPGPISPPEDYILLQNGRKHTLTRLLWTKVFSYLGQDDIARCLAVCRIWNRWCINPELWKTINLSRKRIVQNHLMGMVRRQPESLNLTSVIMTQKQIMWLVERLPLLKNLVISKCSWATISGLCMSACPLLHTLDVSWASGLNDQCFQDLITPPVDRKPAVRNVSRLHRLKSLNLAGTEITDESVGLITVNLSRLEHLDISYCTRVTDKGIQMLASSKVATQETLHVLNVSGCRQLSDASLQAIKNFKNLHDLNVLYCKRMADEKCREFSMKTLEKFKW